MKKFLIAILALVTIGVSACEHSHVIGVRDYGVLSRFFFISAANNNIQHLETFTFDRNTASYLIKNGQTLHMPLTVYISSFEVGKGFSTSGSSLEITNSGGDLTLTLQYKMLPDGIWKTAKVVRFADFVFNPIASMDPVGGATDNYSIRKSKIFGAAVIDETVTAETQMIMRLYITTGESENADPTSDIEGTVKYIDENGNWDPSKDKTYAIKGSEQEERIYIHSVREEPCTYPGCDAVNIVNSYNSQMLSTHVVGTATYLGGWAPQHVWKFTVGIKRRPKI